MKKAVYINRAGEIDIERSMNSAQAFQEENEKESKDSFRWFKGKFDKKFN